MKKCSQECIPCCFFCNHVIHDYFISNEEIVYDYSIGCSLHTDKEHQDIVESDGYCDDFYCFLAKE